MSFYSEIWFFFCCFFFNSRSVITSIWGNTFFRDAFPINVFSKLIYSSLYLVLEGFKSNEITFDKLCSNFLSNKYFSVSWLNLWDFLKDYSIKLFYFDLILERVVSLISYLLFDWLFFLSIIFSRLVSDIFIFISNFERSVSLIFCY